MVSTLIAETAKTSPNTTPTSETAAKLLGKGICKTHEQEIKYFCKQCTVPICADCAMFSQEHKGHEFDHLKNVYEQSMSKLKPKITDVQLKLTNMEQEIRDIVGTMKKLEDSKVEKKTRMTETLRQFEQKLSAEHKEKMLRLRNEKKNLMKEYKEFKAKLEAVTDKVVSSNKVEIVLSCAMIEKKLAELSTKHLPEFKSDPSIFKYSSDRLLGVETHTFYLKPFSSFSKTDTVYSDPVSVNGISWRLKVYPNGNGSHKGTYLSVFVEMFKGWPDSKGCYEYRIELIGRADRSRRTTKEHMSEFETNVSWGYNRFVKLEQLEREGYLIPEEDLLEFRYSVQPSNEFQLLADVHAYITHLENVNKQVSSQIDQSKRRNSRL